MAEGQRMTAREAANKVMAVEHADVLRESVALMVREIMEVEVARLAGAELGERSPERLAQRNGYRERRWDTRVGEIELAIPRLRRGSYLPSFLEPRRRAEQALVAVVQEAYVNGVDAHTSTLVTTRATTGSGGRSAFTSSSSVTVTCAFAWRTR